MRLSRNVFRSLVPAILICALLTTAALAAEPSGPLADAIGQVVSLSGTVIARQPDGQLRVLDLDHEVIPKDVILTGCKSSVEILFRDDSVLSQGPDSSTALDDFVFTADPSAAKMLLKMGTGTVRYVTGQIVKQNPDGFAIATPSATIGIRGTEVFAQTREDGEEIGVLSMTPGHVVNVSTPQATQTMSRAGLSVTATRDGRVSDPSPTSPETRSRVMQAAPQTTQGEPGPATQSKEDLDRKVEAFKAALDRSKSEIGGLGEHPDYGRLHNLNLQKTGQQQSESSSRSAASSNPGVTGGDSDGTAEGGGQEGGW